MLTQVSNGQLTSWKPPISHGSSPGSPKSTAKVFSVLMSMSTIAPKIIFNFMQKIYTIQKHTVLFNLITII